MRFSFFLFIRKKINIFKHFHKDLANIISLEKYEYSKLSKGWRTKLVNSVFNTYLDMHCSGDIVLDLVQGLQKLCIFETMYCRFNGQKKNTQALGVFSSICAKCAMDKCALACCTPCKRHLLLSEGGESCYIGVVVVFFVSCRRIYIILEHSKLL